MRFLRYFFGLPSLALVVVAGCEGSAGVAVREEPVVRERVVVEREPVWVQERYVVPGGIPPTARLSRPATYRDMSLWAPHDGMVYLYDVTQHRIVYSGFMHKGEHLFFDNSANRLMLGRHVVMDRFTWREHRYEIYFDSDYRR